MFIEVKNAPAGTFTNPFIVGLPTKPLGDFLWSSFSFLKRKHAKIKDFRCPENAAHFHEVEFEPGSSDRESEVLGCPTFSNILVKGYRTTLQEHLI